MTESGAYVAATRRSVADEEDKPRYRKYQHRLINAYCGTSVLEVGAGTGDFSALFTQQHRVVVTDVDPGAVQALTDRFRSRPEFEARQLDVQHLPVADEPVETVVAINVLEHFDRDADVLASMASLAVPGGTVVLWVPGYPSLYGEFDRRVGHYRRYTPKTLRATIRDAGLASVAVKPVNLLGGLAWWAAVRRGGATGPRNRSVRIYDRMMIPISQLLDRRLRVPFGQSVLGVARVPYRHRDCASGHLSS